MIMMVSCDFDVISLLTFWCISLHTSRAHIFVHVNSGNLNFP